MVADTARVERLADVESLVRNRRSIRRFAEHQVSRELIEEVLRAALWAPSPHNVQPWRYTVLFGPADRERLAAAMAGELEQQLRADGVDAEAIARQAGRSRERITGAPVVLLLSLVTDGLVRFSDGRRTELEWRMAVQSVGAALQTIFLLAAERGLGSCWMAAPMYCPEVVRRVLRLPDRYAPQALVLLGYAAGPGRVRERRPFDEVVELR